jgi:hypothetical protein
MLKLRTEILPVIIGALGTIKKGLDQNPQVISGHQSAVQQQNITLMSTAHSIRLSTAVNRFDLLMIRTDISTSSFNFPYRTCPLTSSSS